MGPLTRGQGVRQVSAVYWGGEEQEDGPSVGQVLVGGKTSF